ncbi:MAG: EamA family transporter [Galactobacter sp.]|uniref:DMT family transporter n=1 Tax=Galactobacter sp. TaxID=2676125 RepID=UPI0025B7A8AD|nr:DMT family transporter [Galactobacter sp.]
MTGTALAMVLTAAVLHAVWNLAAKRVSGDGFAFVWWYNLFSVVLWLPVGLAMLWQGGFAQLGTLVWAALVSGVIHIVYQLSLQTGYAKADLNVVYPVARGVGPLLSMIVAVLVLGERPGVQGLVGGVVILAGIAVITTGAGASASRTGGTGAQGRMRSGLAWGAFTGAAIAGYTLWDDHSMASLGLLPVPYFVMCCVWQTLLMTPALPRATGHRPLVPVLRRNWWQVLVVAAASPLAYILVLQAMRTTDVSLVAPARETSIVIGALLGWLLFKEARPGRRLLGAAVVLTGIALIVA